MTLVQRLVLFALFISLAPMATIGVSLLRVGETALRTRIVEHQVAVAEAIAARLENRVQRMAEGFAGILELIDVMELSEAERQGVLLMLYQQASAVRTVALLDADGKPWGRPFFQDKAHTAAGHPLSNPTSVQRFFERLPHWAQGSGRQGALLMSPVFFDGGIGQIALLIPTAFATGEDGQSAPRAFAAVEITLSPQMMDMAGLDPGEGAKVFVVDKTGQVVFHSNDAEAGLDFSKHGAVATFLSDRVRSHQYSGDALSGDGRRHAAMAAVGSLGWLAVVDQGEREAFASAHAMRQRILWWFGITSFVVLLLSLAFAGSLRKVLRRLQAGARAFGQGELGQKISAPGQGELTELADTMNQMATDLLASRERLEEWNRTLEDKVDERTRELKQAQAEVLTQSKLAAIGQLGAGVAHEINNPLAGVLGYTQLLMRRVESDSKEYELLQRMEVAARRCKEITLGLLRFSERGLGGVGPVSLNELLKETCDLFRAGLNRAAEGEVQSTAAEGEEALAEAVKGAEKWQLEYIPCDPDTMFRADPGEVSVVVFNVLSNAQNAMPEGGPIQVACSKTDDAVEIRIEDQGIGIEKENLDRIFEPFFTTKKVWTGVGLGMSVVYRVVQDHGGDVTVDSEVGEGTVVTLRFPIDGPKADTEGRMDRRRAVTLE